MRRLGTLALVALSTVFAFVLLEVGLRLRSSEPPALQAAALPPDAQGLPQLDKLNDLIRGDVRGVFKGALHRTNSRGVRGPEYTDLAAPGVFRIAVVGDSYTMGQSVAEEEAYPAVSEALLREAGRRVEVINLGVAGFAIRHSVMRLKKTGIPYRPHLLVYGFTPNDIMGPDYIEPSEDVRESARAEIRRFADSPSHLLRTLWPRFVLVRSAYDPLPGTYEHTLERNYFHNPAASRQLDDGLDDLADLARSMGVCGHVFIHTRMNQLVFHPFERIYRHVADAAERRGLSAGISLPHFRGRDVRALRLSDIDSHPNAAGHRLHSEALVEDLLALPDHCWRPGHYEPAEGPA